MNLSRVHVLGMQHNIAMPLPELSEQELLFVEEYCKDRNATRAGLAAGISTSYQSAAELTRRLLKKVEIKTWIKHLLQQQAKALKFKPSKIIRNWMLAASSDLTYFEVNADGKLTTAPGVPREYLRTVRKMKQTRTEELRGETLTIEIKTDIELRDPFGPESKLMEHFKEISGDGNTTKHNDILDDLAALLARRLPANGGSADVAREVETDPPVVTEAGSTGDSVSE